MSSLDINSRKLTPSHYGFLGNGEVAAVESNDPMAVGPLPEGWNQSFWEWDYVLGEWVQLVDKYREHCWNKVKGRRYVLSQEPISVGENVLDADDRSVSLMLQRLSRMENGPPNSTTKWTMANNVSKVVSKQEIRDAIDAIDSRTERLHGFSQAARSAIFDPTNDTLNKLNALMEEQSWM